MVHYFYLYARNSFVSLRPFTFYCSSIRINLYFLQFIKSQVYPCGVDISSVSSKHVANQTSLCSFSWVCLAQDVHLLLLRYFVARTSSVTHSPIRCLQSHVALLLALGQLSCLQYQLLVCSSDTSFQYYASAVARNKSNFA